MKNVINAAVLMAVVLFGWSYLSHKLPWGQGAVIHVTTLGEGDELQPVPGRIRVPNQTLTTTVFDRSFMGHLSFYETVEAISVIMTQPSGIDRNLYWGVELLTQIGAAIFLAIVLVIVKDLPFNKQMLLVACAALAAGAATYGHMLNWWGMPRRYGVGAWSNLVIGWVLAAAIASKLVLAKSTAVAATTTTTEAPPVA